MNLHNRYNMMRLDLSATYGSKLGAFLANRFAKLIRQTGQDPCMDNFRIAEVGNAEQEAEYERLRSSGCCGSVDATFDFDDKKYMIGFNYGH